MDDYGYPPPTDPDPGTRGSEVGRDSGEGGGHRAPVATRWSRWAVLVPAAALLLGFALGAALMGVGPRGPGRPPAAEVSAPVTPSTTISDADESAVVVPRACVRAAESVQEAATVLRAGVASLRDFHGRELVEALNNLEDLEMQAREQAAACTAADVVTSPEEATSPSAGGDVETTTSDATETPVPGPSPISTPSSTPKPRRSR